MVYRFYGLFDIAGYYRLVYELIGVSFPPPGGFLQTYLIWKSII